MLVVFLREWCKLQILVFRMESRYIYPFRYCLGLLCIKKFTKNALTLTTKESEESPLGVSLACGTHCHIGLP